MNGVRNWVLQDLPHILPRKGFQFSASRLHTTPSSQRLWSFFEFSTKEEVCHDSKKCPSSKNVVSSLFNEETTSSSTPQINPYHFDLKPVAKPKRSVQKTFVRPDDLTSVLDGKTVPRNLKWKLKGYKTLRNEQAEDFAFVPGGKSYDLDILPQGEWLNTTTTPYVSCQAKAEKEIVASINKNQLSLTTKAIENKEKAGKQSTIVNLRENNSKSNVHSPDDRKSLVQTKSLIPIPFKNTKTNEPSVEKAPIQEQKLLAGTQVKKDLKYLPLINAEAPANVIKSQSQPSFKFSSRPPPHSPNFPPSKPAKSTAKQSPKDLKSDSTTPKTPAGIKEANAASEWSTMEATERTSNPSRLINLEKPMSSKPQAAKEQPVPRASVEKSFEKIDSPDPRSTTYFAPRSTRTVSSTNQITLKVNPKNREQPQRTSPCAATLARSQQSSGQFNETQGGSLGGLNGSSMPGNSGSGSRKPPNSLPPISTTPRRSSSSKSFSRVFKQAAIGVEDSSQRVKTKNSSSSISTTVASYRRCNDGCKQPRKKCPKQPKKRKSCQRYCCPELRVQECQYRKCPKPRRCRAPSCQREERGCKRRRSCDEGNKCKKRKSNDDTTCLPPRKEPTCKRPPKPKVEEDCCGGRRICTDPCRKRSCKPERSCKQERQSKKCKKDEGTCARVICTKPRQSCDQCNECPRKRSRSAKCSGRRHFSYMALSNQSKSSSNLRKISSTISFSFLSLKLRASGINDRSYGSDKKPFGDKMKMPPPSCKEDKCKKQETTSCEEKCKRDEPIICEKKCKKDEIKCPKKKCDTKCKTTKKDPCKDLCTKSAVDWRDCCKPKEKKKKEEKDPCKKIKCPAKKCTKAKKCEESPKERSKRELKEMKECKKQKKETGKCKKGVKKFYSLERVISPCKQQQQDSGAGKCGGTKTKYTGLPTFGFSNYLLYKQACNFALQEEGFNDFPYRLYSTAKANFPLQWRFNPISDRRDDLWKINKGTDFGHEELPIPIPLIENPEEEPEETSSSKNNWFFSWFK